MTRDEAALAGRYRRDVHRALDDGDESVLNPYRGLVIDGHELETDLDVIEEMGRTGALDAMPAVSAKAGRR